MSRTKRTTTVVDISKENLVVEILTESDAHDKRLFYREKKLTPYIKRHMGMSSGTNKFEMKEKVNCDADGRTYRSRTGFGARQALKNANRSLKKGKRQENKKIIIENLNEANEHTLE